MFHALFGFLVKFFWQKESSLPFQPIFQCQREMHDNPWLCMKAVKRLNYLLNIYSFYQRISSGAHASDIYPVVCLHYLNFAFKSACNFSASLLGASWRSVLSAIRNICLQLDYFVLRSIFFTWFNHFPYGFLCWIIDWKDRGKSLIIMIDISELAREGRGERDSDSRDAAERRKIG